MDEQDIPFDSHQQLYDELLKLTQTESSGTLIVNTNDGKMARFLIDKGLIHSIHHDEHNGVDTLPGLRAINGGNYSFIQGFEMDMDQPDLPDTTEILSMLKEEAQIQAGSGVYEQLIAEAQLELTKIVGPIADILVQDYLKAKGGPVSLDDFRSMLDELGSNITNEEKANQFIMELTEKARK